VFRYARLHHCWPPARAGARLPSDRGPHARRHSGSSRRVQRPSASWPRARVLHRVPGEPLLRRSVAARGKPADLELSSVSPGTRCSAAARPPPRQERIHGRPEGHREARPVEQNADLRADRALPAKLAKLRHPRRTLSRSSSTLTAERRPFALIDFNGEMPARAQRPRGVLPPRTRGTSPAAPPPPSAAAPPRPDAEPALYDSTPAPVACDHRPGARRGACANTFPVTPFGGRRRAGAPSSPVSIPSPCVIARRPTRWPSPDPSRSSREIPAAGRHPGSAVTFTRTDTRVGVPHILATQYLRTRLADAGSGSCL
jgi:hypothetical protein